MNIKHETCLKHEHHVRNINITHKRGGQSNSYTLSIVKREVALLCLVLKRGGFAPIKVTIVDDLGMCVCMCVCVYTCVCWQNVQSEDTHM